jgi:hypothetical protein
VYGFKKFYRRSKNYKKLTFKNIQIHYHSIKFANIRMS